MKLLLLASELLFPVLVWFLLIRPALKRWRWSKEMLDALDYETSSLWGKFKVKSRGTWTAVVAGTMSFVASLPTLLSQLTGVQWNGLVDTKTAGMIVAALGLLIAVLHVYEDKQHRDGS